MATITNTRGEVVTVVATDGRVIFGPPPQDVPSEPDPKDFDPETLTEFRQVTNNTAYHRVLSGSGDLGMTAFHSLDVRSASNRLQFQLTAIPSSSGSAITQPTIIKRVGLVDERGTYHPALFGGEPGRIIEPGSFARTDPIRDSVVLAPGSTATLVVEYAPNTIFGGGTLKSLRSDATALAPGAFVGTVPPMNSNELSRGLTGAYGMTLPEGERATSLVVVGDSFMDRGWANWGAERNGLAWSDWSVWLDRTHVSRDPALDKVLLDRIPETGPIPYDVAFIGWGGNDRSEDLDGWLRKSIASWRFFESLGCLIATKTLHPYTNSTDKWSTAEGQTLKAPSVEPARTARNDWLRDGAPIDSVDNPLPTGTTDSGVIRIGDEGHPMKYPVFDEADTCETERNSGLWKFDGGQWTTDGAHLTPHGNARMADAFTKWVADNLV